MKIAELKARQEKSRGWSALADKMKEDLKLGFVAVLKEVRATTGLGIWRDEGDIILISSEDGIDIGCPHEEREAPERFRVMSINVEARIRILRSCTRATS